MIARLWKTEIDADRLEDFQRFANEQSLPMFKQQKGFLGVQFWHNPEGCVTLSLWEDMASVEALKDSETYQQTVKDIEASGLIRGEQTVEVFAVFGGTLDKFTLSP